MATLPQPPTDHNQAPLLPESPCRLTCAIDTEPYGRVHITTSGTTAAETVTLLRQTVLELRAVPQPVPTQAAPTLEALLASDIRRALASGDQRLVYCLAHAAILMSRDALHVTDTPGAYTVESESDPTREYAVTNGSCACADYRYHAQQGDELSAVVNVYCKHSLLCGLYARVAEPW